MGNVNFSLEVTTQSKLSDLPKLKDIYITFLPGTGYEDVVRQTAALSESGFNPIPVSYTHLTLPTIRSV